LVGSVVFWTFIELTNGLLRQAIDNDYIPSSLLVAQDLAATRFILMGLLLAALMVWRPQGILGNRQDVLLDVR